ncbi:MAG TPA: MATE family efflux transporter, partial [Firmicutes bacterium]|nr:MATE family efflux transporter [Bacillota bacterium]
MMNIIQEDKVLYKQLLDLALPIMGANLLQMFYNLADAYFLGKLGKEALSAPSIAFTLIFFMV